MAKTQPRSHPAPVHRLVGRSAELHAVEALLSAERLVTLIGPPGIGKTRLALEVAARRPLGEVAFVDLAEEGLDAIRHVRGKLILLDNAERAGATLGPLLEALIADGAGILVTSLVRLGLAAERCCELGPLPLEDAVELYEDRASRLAGDSPGDRASIESLVRRLDCVPLALELAASRSRTLRPRQLLARLESGFEALKDPAATGRHASIGAAVAWAWTLLSREEEAALATLSVFSGGFSPHGAEAILGAAALDRLESLRDKSFLLREGERLRMLEPVRTHAARILARSEGATGIRNRHVSYYASFASGIDGAPDTGDLARLVEERENLLLAHAHATGGERARISLALVPVLAMQGPPGVEVEILSAGVEAAKQAGDPLLLARTLRARALSSIRQGWLAEARRDLDQSAELAADDGELRLHVTIERGRLHFAEGAFEEARLVLDGCIERARRLDLPFFEGYAANLLGQVEEARGHLEESAGAFEGAIRLFRRHGTRRFAGIARMNLGVVRVALGRLSDAAWLFEQAILDFLAVGDRAGEADAVLNLGGVHLTAGRLDDAEPLLRRGLGLERELGNRRAEAFALGFLGLAAHDRGELRSAAELLSACLDVCGSCGERHFRGIFLPFRGAVLASLGQLDDARADFAEARAYRDGLGDPAPMRHLEILERFLDGSPPPEEVWSGHRNPELLIARRLASRAFEWREGATAGPSEDGEEALVVGPEAGWFRIGSGEPVDLRRRRAHRLILRALVDQRLSAPGIGLSLERLFELGWPGESALPSAAAARVYMAIRALRALGLGERLCRQDDGYLLAPAEPVRRAPEA